MVLHGNLLGEFREKTDSKLREHGDPFVGQHQVLRFGIRDFVQGAQDQLLPKWTRGDGSRLNIDLNYIISSG